MNCLGLSIMQPYVFPYIGYFHLIEATDKIVFSDDVNYKKKGWINRNRILINGSDFRFTIPVQKASQNKLINQIVPLIDKKFKKKFFTQIETAYKKAPYYYDVSELIFSVLNQEYNNIADLSINSITSIYDYLTREIKWAKSSVCFPSSKGMEKADRLIKVTKNLGYDKYVNPIGGRKIYNKEYFKKQDIRLNFVQSIKIPYQQFGNDFVPWLSIIDILMFNDIKTVKELFNAYNIV